MKPANAEKPGLPSLPKAVEAYLTAVRTKDIALLTHCFAGDALVHDESHDHLPQLKWLRTIADGRQFILRANDMTALLGAVRAGLGLAVLPQAIARDDKTLRQVATPTAVPSRDLWIVFHREVRHVAAIRAVIDHLTAILTEGSRR